MTKKTRKPLNDALARQFVYGGETDRDLELDATDSASLKSVETATESRVRSKGVSEVTSETCSLPSGHRTADSLTPTDLPHPSNSQQSERTTTESSLMNKLQVEPKEATTRFTVDLPNSMHRKLSILAAKTGRKKAEIVRMLLAETLVDEVESL